MIGKKIMLILLIFTLCNSNTFVYTKSLAFNDIEDYDYKNDILDLADMGIVEGYEDGFFQPYMNLTRAEFCKMIASIFNIDISFNKLYFNDVDNKYWAFNEIMYMVSQGYMTGYEDNTFKPEENITVRDALTVMVNILGYKYKALSQGGYPSGYEIEATQLRLTKGISSSYSKLLTRGEACKIISNSLDIPLVELTGVGADNKYTIDNDNTLLTKFLKMERGKGIVTANDLVSIQNKNLAPEDKIIINDLVITPLSVENRNLVGLKVNYIVKIDDYSETKELISIRKDENTELIIDRDDFVSIIDNKISYIAENEKERSIKISKTTDIIYNGEFTDFYDTLFEDIIYGDLRFVSTENNGIYDIIFINDYNVNINVGNINKTDMIVSDKDDHTNRLSLDPKDKKVLIFDSEGNITDFSAIDTMDIISAKVNVNNIEAYIGATNITGKIEAIITDENSLLINEGEYKLNPYAKDNYGSVKPGDIVQCYLDFLGNIAFISKQSQDDLHFMYLIKLGQKQSGVETDLFGKFYEISKGLCNYKFSNKLNINGEIEKDITYNTLYDAFKKYDNVNKIYYVDQLTIVKLNENNEIIYIEAAKNPAEFNNFTDGFCITHDFASRMSVSTTNFDYDIYFEAAKPILVLPNDIENASERDFNIIHSSDLVNLNMYTVSAYALSKNSETADFLIMKDDASGVRVPEKTTLSTVKSKTDAVNIYGEIVKRIYYIQAGKEGYVDTEIENDIIYTYENNEYKFSDLEAGDVFTFYVNSENKIASFKQYYDYDSQKITTADIASSYAMGDRTVVRSIKSISKNYITFSKTGVLDQRYRVGAYSITVVNEVNGKVLVQVGSFEDLDLEDTAILQVISRALKNIVVYKNNNQRI